jgi:EAL domain-containing protein (putative c-di-GMP-specific phosphodiesterase class I)/GGDEF domain-containing protein
MKRSLMGLCALLVVLHAASIATEFLAGAGRYPRGDAIFFWRLAAGLEAAAALVLLARMRPNSRHLSTLAMVTVALNFLVSIGIFVWTDSNVIVNQGAFLVVSFFYLVLAGFFSRSPWAAPILGALLAVLAWLFFVVWPHDLFHQELSVPQIEQAMTEVIAFGLSVGTALVFLNNQVASMLAGRAREKSEQLARIAYFDPETELPNGALLELDLRNWNPGSLEAGQRIVLAGFRLDDLEAFNGLKGLDFTTQMVRSIAQTYLRELQRTLEASPQYRGPASWKTLYRVGGSTFLFPFTVPEGTKADTSPMKLMVASALGKVNERLSQGQAIRFHGGFTVYPEDSADPRQLVRNLLNMLHSGNNAASGEFYPFNKAAYREFVRKEMIKESLGPALTSPEIFAVFQPKIRLADGSLAGFEALARWNSPSLGQVPPSEFVPVAEQRGLIEGLTMRILDGTVDLVDALRAQGLKDFRVSANLSPGLLKEEFLRSLEEKLRANGLGSFLELEITEGILMALDPPIIGGFQRLRAQGVTFSIDDFGTGYSNLGYLQSFEAEVLKVDKRFIDGIPGDTKNASLVRAILQMAQSFGMKVVAEGVEYREQRDFLASLGCDQIQGYYYSRPLAAESAVSFPWTGHSPLG